MVAKGLDTKIVTGTFGRRAVAPPPHWMISEEAICARADELARRDGLCSVEEGRRQAEAEYRAAAGWRRPRGQR